MGKSNLQAWYKSHMDRLLVKPDTVGAAHILLTLKTLEVQTKLPILYNKAVILLTASSYASDFVP